MKKALLILAIGLMGLSLKMGAVTTLTYFCHNGYVEIWVTNTYDNPIGGGTSSNTGYCCRGGYCPKGDFWIIQVPGRIMAGQPNWSETELSEEEYVALRTLSNSDGYAPDAAHTADVLAKFNQLKDNPTYQKWIDPLKLNSSFVSTSTEGLDYEIYALTVNNNPNSDKKLYVSLRSNMGNTIAVELVNIITGNSTRIENIPLSLGQNSTQVNLPTSLSGTFIAKFISTKNTM
jgi:hypothetical protein